MAKMQQAEPDLLSNAVTEAESEYIQPRMKNKDLFQYNFGATSNLDGGESDDSSQTAVKAKVLSKPQSKPLSPSFLSSLQFFNSGGKFRGYGVQDDGVCQDTSTVLLGNVEIQGNTHHEPVADGVNHSRFGDSVLQAVINDSIKVSTDKVDPMSSRPQVCNASENISVVEGEDKEAVREKRKSFVDFIKQSSLTEPKLVSWADAVKKKLERKSLAKNNSNYLIPRSVMELGSARFKNVVVGHFFGTGLGYWQVYYFLLRHWKLSRENFTLKADEHLFYLYFNNDIDRKKALEECFLFIVGKVFIVREWTPQVEIQQAAIRSLPIWVNFLQIPKFLAHVDGYSHIASAVGTPLYLDKPTAQGLNVDKGQGRICVEIEYGFDFPTLLDFQIDELEFTITADYDWIPPMCEHCKCFSHKTDLCFKHNLSFKMMTGKPPIVTQGDKSNTSQNQGWKNKGQKPTNAPIRLRQVYKVKEKQSTEAVTDNMQKEPVTIANLDKDDAGVSLVSTSNQGNAPTMQELEPVALETLTMNVPQQDKAADLHNSQSDTLQNKSLAPDMPAKSQQKENHITWHTQLQGSAHSWSIANSKRKNAKKIRDYTSIKGKYEVRDENIDVNQGRMTRSKKQNPEVPIKNTFSAFQNEDESSSNEDSENLDDADILEQYNLTADSDEFDGFDRDFYGANDPEVWSRNSKKKKNNKPKIKVGRLNKKKSG